MYNTKLHIIAYEAQKTQKLEYYDDDGGGGGAAILYGIRTRTSINDCIILHERVSTIFILHTVKMMYVGTHHSLGPSSL